MDTAQKEQLKFMNQETGVDKRGLREYADQTLQESQKQIQENLERFNSSKTFKQIQNRTDLTTEQKQDLLKHLERISEIGTQAEQWRQDNFASEVTFDKKILEKAWEYGQNEQGYTQALDNRYNQTVAVAEFFKEFASQTEQLKDITDQDKQTAAYYLTEKVRNLGDQMATEESRQNLINQGQINEMEMKIILDAGLVKTAGGKDFSSDEEWNKAVYEAASEMLEEELIEKINKLTETDPAKEIYQKALNIYQLRKGKGAEEVPSPVEESAKPQNSTPRSESARTIKEPKNRRKKPSEQQEKVSESSSRRQFAERVAETLRNARVFGIPVSEFVVGMVAGAGTRTLANAFLALNGLTGWGWAVGGLAGAARGGAKEYTAQKRVQGELRNNNSLTEAGRAALIERLQGSRSKLAVATLRGAVVGAIGGYIGEQLAGFVSEHGQDIADWFKNLPGVANLFVDHGIPPHQIDIGTDNIPTDQSGLPSGVPVVENLAPSEVNTIPDEMSLPAGSNPWEVAHNISKQVLGREPTDVEIMRVDQVISRDSNISVPSWNIGGAGFVDHRHLPVNYPLHLTGAKNLLKEMINK